MQAASGAMPPDPCGRRSGWPSYVFIFNRPALTLLVLLAPFVCLALQLRPQRVATAVAAAAAVLVTAVVAQSYSGAAKLGLLVGAATYAVARLTPRAAVGALAAALVAAFA